MGMPIRACLLNIFSEAPDAFPWLQASPTRPIPESHRESAARSDFYLDAGPDFRMEGAPKGARTSIIGIIRAHLSKLSKTMINIISTREMEPFSGKLVPFQNHAPVARTVGPHASEPYSINRFSTIQCKRCDHTFLRYAASCPECGWITRRRKSHKARRLAILCSGIAIALTCFFATHIQSDTNSCRPAMPSRSLASAASARPTATREDPTKVRYLLVREADLAGMPYGPRIGAK